jgi:ParB family chromosome partitioning protein
MGFKSDTVSLDRIDLADRRFAITTTPDKTDLTASIRSVGLLQRPVLLEDNGRWTVVCGFRRIAACSALGMDQIPTQTLDADCSPKRCARIAISENAFQRSLNTVEQARAYALIQQVAAQKEDRTQLAAACGLPASRAAMEKIMPVAQMPAFLQEGILAGRIALPVALQIFQLSDEDAFAVSNLFIKLSPGLNVQRELLEAIGEISRRDKISVCDLIGMPMIKQILEPAETPLPQKVQAVRKLLKHKRYPALSQAEDAYLHHLKTIKLSPRIQLQPPRFFEGRTYRLTLNVNSRRQLKALQPELEKLIRHPHLLPE